MNPDSKDFLKRLVETPSPSGYEHDVQKLVRERINPWCDEVRTDVMGNVFGVRNPSGKPRIMLAGHCDQIGFIVNHITEDGFLHIDPIGGVDPVVAGKPARPLLDETVRRVGGRHPLMVGDRLDTDID